ncbi:hypothetical protein M0812_27846 [Anaeramoeba flamelloides]|uniref:Uncharacterized protein n=1 Tax=Anaeramoeba flamelloides TaxID=1746091 RepID=A0AAV7Y8U2_9EUKA|nr:hypothetical protein M0812_27846 [Anaeramoeba flamelloides]|eukprot:Anaeramoba_flamelloidesa95302_46.p1 GENE.a95302_46~~a95302_46.p1  ORF type:complete len:415 (-),score=89.96 a95302_46:70-1314(-)
MLSQFLPTKTLSGLVLNRQVPQGIFFSSQVHNHFNPNVSSTKKPKTKPKTSPNINTNNYLHQYTNSKIPTFYKCNITRHKHWNKISQEIFNDHIKSGCKELMNNSPQSAAVEFESALELATNDQQRTQCYEQMIKLYRSETKMFSDSIVAINVLKLAKHFAQRNGNFSLQINATICMSDIYALKGNNEKATSTLETIPFKFQVIDSTLEDNQKFNALENQVLNLLSFGDTSKLIKEIIALNALGSKWEQYGYETRAIEILLQTFKCVVLIENCTHNMTIRNTLHQDKKNDLYFEQKYQVSKCLTDAKVEDLIIFRSQTINLITDMLEIYLKNEIFETLPLFLKQLVERLQFQSVIYYLTKILTSIKNHPNRQQLTHLYLVYEIPGFISGLQDFIKNDLLDDLNLLKELSFHLFH